MKKLPIGIQNFREIITEGYYYVDKTLFIEKLLEGKYYFLSRPRRFGKSLFLDTLKEFFSGNKELFKDLYIYERWDWKVKYPVVKISFGSGDFSTKEKFIESLFADLRMLSEQYEIELKENLLNKQLEEFIKKIYKKYNQKVVVLIDEYDKPILDVIENKEIAKENQLVLKNFFSALKELDPYLKFVFLTGVSRFSKVSMFSGLNQLRDITLSSDFATICGYTQKDLETIFADRLKEFDKNQLQKWYNGYNWLGEKVYNPFDILLLFAEKSFKPFWFETGTPTFLIKLFKENNYFLPEIENLQVGEELLSNLDVENIYPENLLFQSGYLTIEEMIPGPLKTSYKLSYPNFEVRTSFNHYFFLYLTPPSTIKNQLEAKILQAFTSNQLNNLKEILTSFFASIPYDWYRKNELDKYEGYYASVVYALFNGAGFDVIAEDITSKGRIDLSVFYQNQAYLIEFKVVDEVERNALEKLEKKKYFTKYKEHYQDIYLIGIEFSKKERNIVDFEFKKI